MLLRLGLLTIAFLFVGCAGTRIIINENYVHSDSDQFGIEIINSANATEAGLSVFKSKLSEFNSELKVNSEDPNKIVTIEFTNYYVRDGATRAMVGIMAGVDNVTTLTRVKDAKTGQLSSMLQKTQLRLLV